MRGHFPRDIMYIALQKHKEITCFPCTTTLSWNSDTLHGRS